MVFDRYFLSNILQFQIFDTMCKIAVTDDKINFYKNSDFPLYKCDIYGAKIAGNKLRYYNLIFLLYKNEN